nr:lipoprotein signal peptidase [Neisseria shayeganii]
MEAFARLRRISALCVYALGNTYLHNGVALAALLRLEMLPHLGISYIRSQVVIQRIRS